MSESTAKNLHQPHDFSLKDVFKADSYQIQQPYIQITQEGYDINSHDNQEKFKAVRPRHIFRNAVARLVGIGALMATLFLVIGVSVSISGKLPKSVGGYVILASVILGYALGIAAYILISRLIAPRRKLSLYAEHNQQQPLLTIMPTSSIFIFNHEYVAKDYNNNVLFTCRKNFLDSFFLKKWHAYSPDNKYLFTAREDSLFMAILRNYVGLGRLIPLHFKFAKNQGQPFGDFIRRYSLRDKYKLNFKNAQIEPWMLMATALLLDTGEER